MKIGDLPVITTLTDIAASKVPIEDATGITKRASVQNLVKSVWDSVVPMTTITSTSTIFEDVYTDNATILSAALRKSGRLYSLDVELILKKEIVISANGNPQTRFPLAQLKAAFVSPNTIYGMAISEFFIYGGWGRMTTDGTLVVDHFDSIGSQYTIPVGSSVKLQFVYMR